jgi:Na+-transporting NADH:ubiquinone oxidoreductase subunit C
VSAKKETLGKTVGVVVAVCLVCSIIVSGAAVGLRELQQANAALDRQSNILAAAGLLGEAKTKKEIGIVYDARVVERFVNLATGEYVANPAEGELKPYDMYGRVSKAPETSTKAEGSPAGFSRRANVASIFLIKDEVGVVSRIILPVHGSGLWD